jgi:hypothetical protein
LPRSKAGASVATNWHSAEEKAKFGNQLLQVIADGFPKPRAVYRTLGEHLGLIAHDDEYGFWNEFFLDERSKAAFVEYTSIMFLAAIRHSPSRT